MKVGSLVKRKPRFDEWVKTNPWMKDFQGKLQVGIIVRIGRSGYWDYEVLWINGTCTHDESELEEIV